MENNKTTIGVVTSYISNNQLFRALGEESPNIEGVMNLVCQDDNSPYNI